MGVRVTAEFKPGDLVRHKTGGPVMCVVVAEAEATCHWWQNGNFHEFPIPVTALAHHEPVDGDGIEQGEPETFREVAIKECLNCGMHAEDHDNGNGRCPGGETVARWL